MSYRQSPRKPPSSTKRSSARVQSAPSYDPLTSTRVEARTEDPSRVRQSSRRTIHGGQGDGRADAPKSQPTEQIGKVSVSGADDR